ncbi:MAG TPA: LysR family transcriptional regulator [Candidatus Limnocylindria bacterium]|nr:LysR family transcriptional regulator [Candidatus Limnocylindria bacterium]
MEMHQLRYVAAVARTGNFSRAAEQCHVAQPSLSQQIHKLEEELGERLFDRMRRNAKLTPAGEAFLPRALRILAEVDAALREAQETQELSRGQITLGALPTIAPYLLGNTLAQFGKRFPNIQVTVQEDTTAQLLKLLEACELDFAITSLPINNDRFETRLLFTEELLLAIPLRHPLASQRTIRIADVEHEKFIILKEGHCLGDQVLRFCSRNDSNPQISCRSAQIETIKALVHSGLGISLIPRMAVPAGSGKQIRFRSFAPPRPERAVAAVWLQNRPPSRAARELLGLLPQKSLPTKIDQEVR